MSDITVASTTDTQEAIDQAAGIEPENSGDRGQVTGDRQPQNREDQASVEEQSGDGREDDRAESEAASGAAEVAGEEEEQQIPRSARNDNRGGDVPPRKNGVQKRIDTLTRRLYEQQEELDALKLARSRDGAPRGLPGPRPRPTPQDRKADGNTLKYSNYEEYVEDLADWKAEQKLLQNRQAELNQAEQERAREVFSNYNEAAKAARVKYEDFEDVVGRSDVQIPQAAQVAIIEAGDAGPDIAYYLGKHPEVCAELVEMSPMRAIARIGQIEAQIQARGHRPQAAAAGRSLVPSQTVRSTVSANKPAPITPVGGSSSRSAVPLSELPYRDYKRIRDKEERESRYR